MVGLTILNSRTNAARGAFARRRAIPLAPQASQPLEGLAPLPFETIRTHDRPTQAALGPRGILLENQDVGGDVQRRMGKPMRRLRALLPGKARGRGYRQDLFPPRFLQAAGCRAVRLQGLCEPFRPGSGLRQAKPAKRPYPELAAAELRLQARGGGPRALLVASARVGGTH